MQPTHNYMVRREVQAPRHQQHGTHAALPANPPCPARRASHKAHIATGCGGSSRLEGA